MNLLLTVATAATAEKSGNLRFAITMGITMFTTLGLLLFLITRLDPDR